MRKKGHVYTAKAEPVQELPEAVHKSSSERIGVERLVVGWREWLALPGLNIPAIKAKIDTGARTSSLHAQGIEPYRDEEGREMVRFRLRPDLRHPEYRVECTAPLADQREVRSSSGHPDHRYFIVTNVAVGAVTWQIELSLTCRKSMKFRMLLGREALRGRCLVEPHTSFLTGKKLANYYRSLNQE